LFNRFKRFRLAHVRNHVDSLGNAKVHSIKYVRSKGRRLSSADVLRTREGGVLQLRTSALFGTKTSDFSKFKVCPQGGEAGWASADISQIRGKVKFSRFCVDVFYGRPLIEKLGEEHIVFQDKIFLYTKPLNKLDGCSLSY